jgi:hypothetical protein
MIQPQQLGFGFDEMLHEQETAHLPGTTEEAIPYYRKMLERHHEAMLSGDIPRAMKIRKEAQDLAIKLNGGDSCGICAQDGPGSILERETVAPEGTVPMWGHEGNFIIDVNGMKVRIELDGLFGVGASFSPAPGFKTHAVDYDEPFLSETGYRSFIGSRPEVEPGMTPDTLAREMILAYMSRECKGKPKRIEQSYVAREMQKRVEKALRGIDIPRCSRSTG